MAWQRQALRYIEIVPELSYASRFYARTLKQLRIYPARVDPGGSVKEIKDGPPFEELERIKDRAGTKNQILGSYGRLMFSTGEGFLCGFKLDTDEEYWNFIWNEELYVEREGDNIIKYVHKPYGDRGAPIEYGPGEAVAYRMWTSSPRLTGEPESPMRATLDVAEELVLLTRAVKATATSRTVNGVLLVPTELTPPPVTPDGDEDPLNDVFAAQLINYLENQIEDVGSAAGASPLVVWGANEYLPQVRKLELHNTQNDYMEQGLRNEAVERLARGLDFPPEVLTGLSNSNHWAALQILWDMWRSHGAPIAQQFCDDLNDSYLRPTLRDHGYEDWNDVIVLFDDSQVIIRPDRADDADAAYDRGQISSVGYRALKNIPEDYAPSEEEHDEWLAIKLREPTLLEDFEPPETPPPPLPPVPQNPETPGRSPEEGPPPPGPEGDSGRKTRVTAAAVAREVGAAEMALARCRELAGIRIKQKEKLCPECVQAANGAPNSLIASVVGADALIQMNLTPLKCVEGGADTLRSLLPHWGYSQNQTASLAEMVEAYAARTLFQSRQPGLPSGFAAHFERARETSLEGG